MSKMLIKIISIVSFIFAGMYFLLFVGVHFFIPLDYFVDNLYDYCLLLTMGIFAFISACGGIAFYHYKDLSLEDLKKKKNWLLVWAVIFVFTCNACAILALLAYICLFDNIFNRDKNDYISELKELDKLRSKGIITDSEFKNKKKKILDI